MGHLLPGSSVSRKPQQKCVQGYGFSPGELQGRKCRALVPVAAAGRERRENYELSATQGSSIPSSVNQVASFLIPAGAFVAFSFGAQ